MSDKPSSFREFINKQETWELMFGMMLVTLLLALIILLLSSIPAEAWVRLAGPAGTVFVFYVLARVLKWWARS